MLRGQVSGGRGIVGAELEPSSSLAAYLTYALPGSVSLSTVFVHVPNARCFSREEYRWKPCVQPSFVHGNTWSLVQSFNLTIQNLHHKPPPPPLKKRSKATEWHRFLLYEKLRTCLPLRKRPWLHHRKLSPGLQHGIIATVTQVPFIEFYVRNVAIFPKKIGVNSIKIVGLLSWGEKLHSRSLRCCVTLFTHITFSKISKIFQKKYYRSCRKRNYSTKNDVDNKHLVNKNAEVYKGPYL